MTEGFVSVVADRNDCRCLLVRARQRGYLEALLGGLESKPYIWEDPDADYRYRAVVYRDEFAKLIASNIVAIEYDNFKNFVRSPELWRVYSDIWLLLKQRFKLGARVGRSPDKPEWREEPDW